jgi:DNA-binding NarL/FixJ family response regulator
MHGLKSATMAGGGAHDASRNEAVRAGETRNGASAMAQTVLYLDSRAFTRDCIGGWLQSSLSGFEVRVLPDLEQIERASIGNERIRAVIISTGPDRMTSPAVASLLARVSALLPGTPVAVLSDYEDPASIREAFNHGVRGYVPTSLTSRVAVEAVRLVCAGGTFAPAATLLSEHEEAQRAAGEPLIEGFTQRQAQILDCLRRGMANKLIAYELDMCESTVKVHIRHIMKKLNATNRTQVAYLTRGFFDSGTEPQHA